MTEKQLKAFIINLIDQKEQQNENFIRYSFFELKVENGLTEKEIDEVLRVSRDYFENKGYKVYFTNAEYEYKNERKKVESNEFLIAFKEIKRMIEMEEKISKQNIDRLNISDNSIKILKNNKIITIGQLCKKSKNDLRKLDILQFDIKKIETELQLLGLNLKNSL